MKSRRSSATTLIGVVLTALMLFPVYWMINVSLTPTNLMRKDPPDWFPVHPTFHGYSTVLHQQLPYLLTSLLVGLGTIVLTLAIAAPAAYSLAKLRPHGTGAINFVLLIAQMIPGIIMALGFYSIFLSTHLVNHACGSGAGGLNHRRAVRSTDLERFHLGHPDEILQAATIDGAGVIRSFTAVVLPISRNGLITVSLFAFLWSWSDFIFASTLDGGGAHKPITLGIYKYIGNNNQEWNSIMATAVVASIPAAVLLVLAQRFVAAGVTAGSVK